MKASRYNYLVPFGEKKIFFNGITEAFFLVSPEYEDAYTKILESPDSQGEWADAFIARMKDSGFILDDDTDEFERVKAKFEELRNGDQYFLMVLPTYQCNLSCWYCIQDHENLFMDDDVLERIKRLIERRMADDSIKRLHLSWFGGEPLMAYDKVCQLTAFAQEYAKTHCKTFTCAITTNATLLNEERVERLHALGVSHYQITIDGDRMTHNSVKKLGSASAYDLTLDNVNRIARHTSISLRFNYTHYNLHPDNIFSTLLDKLDPAVRGNIEFTIFKVWQEKQENVRKEDVDALFNKGIEAGMYSKLNVSGVCYTDWKHYDCVFPNGHVGKCDNHAPEEIPGVLQPDGIIEWNEDMTDYYKPHIFDYRQGPCGKCRHLPVCWGPCVSSREAMIRVKGVINCVRDNPDREMELAVANLCKTRLQRTR